MLLNLARGSMRSIRLHNIAEIRDAFHAEGPLGYLMFDDLPFGAIIATAKISVVGDVDFFHPQLVERALGDYRRGRWCMCLTDVCRLDVPIPFKGRQGWFEVPDSLFPSFPSVQNLK